MIKTGKIGLFGTIIVFSAITQMAAAAPADARKKTDAARCVWAGREFSDGAIFCMGPTNALKCASGSWEPQGYVPCNSAPVADTK